MYGEDAAGGVAGVERLEDIVSVLLQAELEKGRGEKERKRETNGFGKEDREIRGTSEPRPL